MRNSQRILNESGYYGLFKDMPIREKSRIQKIDMVPSDANQCMVVYNGSSVYSNTKFRKGDIVEICPVREISKNSLYTREVRDMVFEVEPNERYVIPMGYCQYYNIVDKSNPVANCDYEWKPETNSIIIRALCAIPKHSVLILNIEK